MNSFTPRIIPRTEHTISRRMLSPNAVRVLYRLHDNGFTAFLVGGCVRDLLLGREPKDFDIVTDATPGQIKRLFRNCRLIGRRFRLAHLHFKEEVIEVATFRSRGGEEPEVMETSPDAGDPKATGGGVQRPRPSRHLKDDEGMVLRDNVFGTPAEDALRRDFTVNALFYTIADFSIIDYVGGLDDLTRGIIRIIGAPKERFTEDPVRMIRAVRFAAMLGFSIEESTWKALLEQSDFITRASPPRLYEECLKLFALGEGEKTYQLMRRTGLFAALFPHFNEWLTRESDGFPHAGVSHALSWVDTRIQEGGKIVPQLLIALMFGQYIEEKGKELWRYGTPQQQGLDLAVAEFLGELAPTVLVPHRVGMLVRTILAFQQRLRKTPGRKPLSVIGRAGFFDALDYLRVTSELTDEHREAYAFWETFMRENPLAPQEPLADSKQSRLQPEHKRRKRRRKKIRSENPTG